MVVTANGRVVGEWSARFDFGMKRHAIKTGREQIESIFGVEVLRTYVRDTVTAEDEGMTHYHIECKCSNEEGTKFSTHSILITFHKNYQPPTDDE